MTSAAFSPAPSGPPGIEIERPGLLATVQDLGRPGVGRYGLSPSGAMDEEAHRLANRLCGNDPGAAALELTGPGALLRFVLPRVFALAGADLEAWLESPAGSRRLPPLFAGRAPAGTVLRFAGRQSGARVSVAFAGGLSAPRLFGSAATDLAAGLAAFQPLGKGATFAFAAGDSDVLPDDGDLAALRVALGEDTPPPGFLRYLPEDTGGVPDATQQLFTRRIFRLSPRSNRTGCRFEGNPLPAPQDPQRLSEPTAPGTLQLPPDGLPILLMADRNTTGGYPRLGQLASIDAPRAAQLWPGDPVRFVATTVERATAALRARAARLDRALLAFETRSRQ